MLAPRLGAGALRNDNVLKFLMVGGLLALQGLLMPASAEPETAVEKAMKAKTVVGALGLLGVVNPVPGKLVLLEVPDIVSAGQKVPVRVASTIAGTDWIAVLVERNATPLSLVKDFTPGIDRTASLNVELKQTSRVWAVVRAGGKYFHVSREVKVATDDCGAQ